MNWPSFCYYLILLLRHLFRWRIQFWSKKSEWPEKVFWPFWTKVFSQLLPLSLLIICKVRNQFLVPSPSPGSNTSWMYYSLKKFPRGIQYFCRGTQTLKQVPWKGERSPAPYWPQEFCSQSSDMVIYYHSHDTVLYFFAIHCLICCRSYSLCDKWSSSYSKLFPFEHPNTFPEQVWGYLKSQSSLGTPRAAVFMQPLQSPAGCMFSQLLGRVFRWDVCHGWMDTGLEMTLGRSSLLPVQQLEKMCIIT